MGNVEESIGQTGTQGAPGADRKDTEALRDKTRTTATQLRERAAETRDQVRDQARQAGAQVQAWGDEALDVASAYYEQGRETLRAWEETLERQLREKPIQSLLIAGGVGLLLGLLWRRR